MEEMYINITRNKTILHLDNKEILVGDLLTLQIGIMLLLI